MSGDSFGHPNGAEDGHLVSRGQEAAVYPIMQRTAPHNEALSTQIVNSTQIEKPYTQLIDIGVISIVGGQWRST